MRVLLVGAVIAAGCSEPAPTDRCEVSQRSFALDAAERKVVGEASPYPADALLRARTAELDRSQRARREVAWEAVGRIVAPVPLAEDLPAHAGPETLPRWHTWYGKDDLVRIFQKVFRPLPAEHRLARDPLPDDALDDAFAWNPRAVEELASWPEQRWLDYLASLDEQVEVDGVGALHRVGYAPAAARHVLASYAEEMQCLSGAPPAFVDGPPVQPLVTREALALGACEERVFGPYFVASGEHLSAHADAALSLVRDTPDGEVACTADAGDACAFEGPGAVWLTVRADGTPIDGELEVAHTAPDAPWAACLDGRFSTDAAVIKADWRRAELEFQLPLHDTSAAGLAAVGAGGDDGDWGEGVGTVDPGADDIYTMVTSAGDRFRLAALHLMTRELDHWLWVTLWWSPDPDTDFGADRPAEIAALDGPWRNYKMCAVTAFAEGDPDPGGGFDDDHPDLAAALSQVYPGEGGPSWCSNPYLEVGHGNAGTNCVGCHQHGGTDLTAEAIIGSPDELPASGRTQVRNNFPSDYSWAPVSGDRLAEMLRDEVLYWDEVP